MNIVKWPTYPEKFIRHVVKIIATFRLLRNDIIYIVASGVKHNSLAVYLRSRYIPENFNCLTRGRTLGCTGIILLDQNPGDNPPPGENLIRRELCPVKCVPSRFPPLLGTLSGATFTLSVSRLHMIINIKNLTV